MIQADESLTRNPAGKCPLFTINELSETIPKTLKAQLDAEVLV